MRALGSLFCALTLGQQLENVSVGLWKNGYAFFSKNYRVSEPGTFLLDLPSTVHGTLMVSSPQKGVSVSTLYDVVDVPGRLDAFSSSLANLQQSFAGKEVTLKLKSETITGTLARFDEEPDGATAAPISASLRSYVPLPASNSDFLVLENADGLTMVKQSEVISFKVTGAKPTRKEKRYSIIVDGTFKNRAPIQVSYLTYGLSWAPSYSVNVNGPTNLNVSFQATIRNEGANLNAQDASLITGFPNMKFAGVTSLLSSDLSGFMSQVDSLGSSSRFSPGIMAQSVMSNSAYGMAENRQSTEVANDGSDVMSQSIGPLSLKPNSAILKNIATASATYQAVVTWDAKDDEAWDALRFLNPFPTAITTAPVSVIQGTGLLGQSMSEWTPPKGLAIVKTSKALSVQVWKSESQGTEVPIGSSSSTSNSRSPRLSQVTVDGVLNIVNSRSTNITMCVEYEFTGVLVPTKNSNHAPKATKLIDSSSSDSLNPRTSVNWELVIQPGASASFSYQYTFKQRAYY